MDAPVASESNKIKKSSLSPGNSSGSDDDDKLKVKKRGEETVLTDSSDYWSSASSSSDSEQVDSDPEETSDNDDDCDDEAQEDSVSEELSKAVVAFYNNEAWNNEDTMEVTKVRDILSQLVPPTMIYFISFDATLTGKVDKVTRVTNCRSVLLEDPDPEGFQVYSLKLGALGDTDRKKWFTWRPARMVVYSESLTELQPPPKKETASGTKEDVDTDIRFKETYADDYMKDLGEDDSDDGDDEVSCAKPRIQKCSYLPVAAVRQFAKEAVAHYNKKGDTYMMLQEIKGFFSYNVGIGLYHIKFNARIFLQDRLQTRYTTCCQAVVSSPDFGGIKVWSLKFSSVEGNNTNEMFCKKGDCKCGISWNENEELLKYACPDWYRPSDDELVEDKKMKQQPRPALTQGSFQNSEDW